MSEMVSVLAKKFMDGARKSGYLQMEEDIPRTFPLDCLPKDLQAYVLELQRAEHERVAPRGETGHGHRHNGNRQGRALAEPD